MIFTTTWKTLDGRFEGEYDWDRPLVPKSFTGTRAPGFGHRLAVLLDLFEELELDSVDHASNQELWGSMRCSVPHTSPNEDAEFEAWVLTKGGARLMVRFGGVVPAGGVARRVITHKSAELPPLTVWAYRPDNTHDQDWMQAFEMPALTCPTCQLRVKMEQTLMVAIPLEA